MEKMKALQAAVVEWWIGDAGKSVELARKRAKIWYSTDTVTDNEILDRFGSLVEAACRAELTDWQKTPRGSLALVILTDQFTRNVYRFTPKAFEGDSIAMEAAECAIERCFDQTMSVPERSFLYHPFMHSESKAHQQTSIALFERLRSECPPEWEPLVDENLRFAKHHRQLIREFGRFPHRNAVLGRRSTPEELEYLETANRFGQ